MNMLAMKIGVILVVVSGLILPAFAGTDSLINIGDFLYIEVYRHEDISAKTQVNAEGNITLNYVGQVNVIGLTESQASARVSSALKRILKNPRVTVSKTSMGTFTAATPRQEDMNTAVIPLNTSKAKNISTALQGMSTDGGSISYVNNTNTLIITDVPSTIENIRAVINQLDGMANQMESVRIETKFVEVQAGALKEVGIRWWAESNESSGGFYPPLQQTPEMTRRKANTDPLGGERIGSESRGGTGRQFVNSTDYDGRRLQVPVQVPTPGQMFYGLMNDSVDIGVFIDALESKDKAELLARQVVLATNNRVADFKLGEVYPYTANTSFVGGGAHQTVEFMDIGIKVEVVPHIIEHEPKAYIELDLKTEVSHFAGSSNGVPIRSQRSYNNSNKVLDGQSLIIGGVFRKDDKNMKQEMPVLGRVPLLKHLFSHKEKVKISTELLVFVTPNIHRTPESVTLDSMIGTSEAKLMHSTLEKDSIQPNETQE